MKRYPSRSGNKNVGIAEKRNEREWARPNDVASSGAVRSVANTALGVARALTTNRAFLIPFFFGQ